jgi:hypothetical protein
MSALPLKANIAQRGLMLSANSGHHYFIGVLAVFNRIRGIAANKNPKQERNTLAGVSFAFAHGPGQQLRYALRNTWPGDRSLKQREKAETVPSRRRP